MAQHNIFNGARNINAHTKMCVHMCTRMAVCVGFFDAISLTQETVKGKENKERNQQLLTWINTSRLSLLQLISLILVVSTCDSH